MTITLRGTLDHLLRPALWLAVLVNLTGVILFTALGLRIRIPFLPSAPTPFLAAEMALVIGIFAGVYAWLAMQHHINRPLLIAGALGKVGFTAIAGLYWWIGDLTRLDLMATLPDLVLGLFFLLWVMVPPAKPIATSGRRRYPDTLPANRYIVRPMEHRSRSRGRRQEDGELREQPPEEPLPPGSASS